jgi:hypothetical protein
MLGTQMTQEHPTRAAEQAAGDRKALRARLLAKHSSHVFADDFDARVEGMHHGLDDTAAGLAPRARDGCGDVT